MTLYNIVASTSEATVVSECPPSPYRADSYQSEADLERDFIAQLERQGYEYIQFHNEIALRRKQYEYYRDKLLTFKPIQPPL